MHTCLKNVFTHAGMSTKISRTGCIRRTYNCVISAMTIFTPHGRCQPVSMLVHEMNQHVFDFIVASSTSSLQYDQHVSLQYDQHVFDFIVAI